MLHSGRFKHKNICLQPLLGAMLALLMGVCVLTGMYGCEKKHTCDTALEWQCSATTELGSFLLQQDLYQYDEAQLYCENLVLKGRSDWRLPTDCELSALASRLGTQDGRTPLSSRIATCWSSTPYHDSLLRYWAVSVFNKQSAPLSKDTYNAVICVRDTAR
ncbi:MAG: DUF1566 domain-containing protein [Thermodesulfobacteriota bacterium]